MLQSQLQIYHLHNYDYSDDVKHEDIIQEADLEVKIEPVEHDEPETFVNDFVVDVSKPIFVPAVDVVLY